MLIKNTASRRGHYRYASPDNTKLQFLRCGWIRLDGDRGDARLGAGHEERVLIATSGHGRVSAGDFQFEVSKYDAIFIPPGLEARITTQESLEMAEASAPSSIEALPVHVRYDDARADPDLAFEAGKDLYRRSVVKLVDKNVEAERLLCGVTFGAPGNWTSWAPHEHAATREEVYLYIDMPAPAFGVQMIYTDLEKPELIVPVFEHDAVVITKGYHPNVAIPGFGINYVWMMAGLKPHEDRAYADMHWQEEFSGLYE